MAVAMLQSSNPRRQEVERCREQLAGNYVFPDDALKMCTAIPYQAIDAKLKNQQALSFDEAYVGMLSVLAATNTQVYTLFFERGLCENHMQAVARAAAFLQGMALHEVTSELEVEEISGLIAAASLDLIVRLDSPEQPVFEMCGMGGDRGLFKNGVRYKTINASTLTSVLLARSGRYAIKHGSGRNTSAVGSTEAIEDLGLAHRCTSLAEIQTQFKRERFMYIDAAMAKTVHDLSALMRIETVNHLVGPLTLPVTGRTPVTKILGVNGKVTASTGAKVLVDLHRRNILNIQNVAVVCGYDQNAFSEYPPNRQDVVLDELSPFLSEVALVVKGEFVGSYFLTLHDFGVEALPDIWIENDPVQIMHANRRALAGESHCEYLAMNLALALFLEQVIPADFEQGFPYANLQRQYEEALKLLTSRFANCLAA